MDRVAAGDPPGRPAARAPRRHLSVPARDDVRLRARPARVRRALGHDEGAARGVRDVLELRRGRAPLGARARRHARGAAEARRAVRAHRPRPSIRGPAVRDRRALGPRPDAGSDLQAAQRLRAGRPRRAVARATAASPRSRTATSRSTWSATRSTRRPATRQKKRAKNDVSGRQVVVLGSGNLGLVYLMEEHRRLSMEEIDGATRTCSRRCASIRTSASCSSARTSTARSCSAAPGCATSPTIASRATTRSQHFSPTAAEHLRRTDGFAHVADIMVNSFYDPQLDGGLRIRGADLVPRRDGRPADTRPSSCIRRRCRPRWGRSSAPRPFMIFSRAGVRSCSERRANLGPPSWSRRRA